jgi:copper chaperone CopZ
MALATYHVTGMTCEHCTRAVSAELSALEGVTGVTADLVPGGASAITVESAAPLADGTVAAALDEAGGYQLAAPAADGLPVAAPERQLRLLP